jgi:hypothetical protein
MKQVVCVGFGSLWRSPATRLALILSPDLHRRGSPSQCDREAHEPGLSEDEKTLPALDIQGDRPGGEPAAMQFL